jgi:2-succinyl-5-enolpyruvyl-6-hydroxy-3-cyclohexene-1-carboxylate synthase
VIPINSTYAAVGALVDELARCGLRRAVTSPGSRNAPIALALAGDERIDAVSVIDERAAGFVALGMAKASATPVAVTCTSGTAAANLLPAVVEAHHARVPLIVLTADRPPELRDVGAGQAIDQIGLYGSAAKWFVEVGSGGPGRAWATHLRALGCRAWWTAAGGRPGPVHLNVALREPLAPVPDPGLDPEDWVGRADGAPWVTLREHAQAPDGTDVQALAERALASPRGAIVCGGGAEGLAQPVARLAVATGWPALAEPTSGLRCGAHDRSHVIAHYDVLLRGEAFARAVAPELVVRVGDTPTSKPLRAWLARADQVVIDPHAVWHEPTRAAATILRADPARTCDALAAAVEARGGGGGGEPSWLERWRAADELVPAELERLDDPSEPKLYAALERLIGDGALLWVSSSMPIRYVEAFLPRSPRDVRFLSNRGANGIDGVVSSAAGAAYATGAPTFVLIGELALLHDLGGLLAARRAGIDLTVICANNGGGGIFDFLPVAEHADREAYERHVATPANVDLAAIAALAGLRHRAVRTPSELADAVSSGPGLIELPTDREASVAASRALDDAVAHRLAGD